MATAEQLIELFFDSDSEEEFLGFTDDDLGELQELHDGENVEEDEESDDEIPVLPNLPDDTYSHSWLRQFTEHIVTFQIPLKKTNFFVCSLMMK